MCLIKTHDEPKIAQADIEVWKILTNKGLSPYHEYQYHHGINKPAEHKEIPIEQRLINGGYLHSYRKKEMAELNVLKCIWIIGVEHVIHRMIIPKGTAYYEGDNGDMCSECLYWPEEETAATL